jgi:acyl-CoA synthetase (AMP-forming)/AMP-acid ligase II
MAFPEFTPALPEFLRTRTEQFGDRPLILLNEDRITYAEAAERSDKLARGLLASGVGKGTRVGLLMPNGPDWVIGWLAAARIGGVVVPMNAFYKPREFFWVLRHADLSAYKVPRHYFFYGDGELPFTDSGKIDKPRLTELHLGSGS